eukprot:328339-Rhodomonas_salina.1
MPGRSASCQCVSRVMRCLGTEIAASVCGVRCLGTEISASVCVFCDVWVLSSRMVVHQDSNARTEPS